MSTITVAIPDDRMQRLHEAAARLGVAPEDLVRVSIEELLARPDDKFERAVAHVLAKNAELYRRLA
jgi:antitoxin FitA